MNPARPRHRASRPDPASPAVPRLAAALLLGFTGLLTARAAEAQSVPYIRTQFTAPYVPITGGTPVPFFSNDDSTASIPIGFSFPFYGQSYTSVSVGTNGAMSFTGAFIPTGSFSTPAIPDSFAPNALIAPFWDDLYISTGAVTYQTLGAAPNRELVVQWQAVGHYSAGSQSQSNLTMQVRLSEASGAIRMHYGPFNPVPAENVLWAGTIGMENETGTVGELALPCAASSACGVTELLALNGQVIEYSQPAGVELVATGVPPTGGNPGDPISIPVTARNIGTLSSSVAFEAAVYLSTDTTVTSTDTLLGTVTFAPPLGPRSARTATVGATVPNLSPGFYSIGVIVDSTNAIAEDVEGNNTALLTTRFLVGADLSVDVDTPEDSGPGETIDVTVRVLNLGAAQPAVPVRLWYSSDPNLDPQDTLVASATVAVPAAPSTAFPLPVVIPNLVPGRYYAIAEVDPANLITEADETNNVAASPATSLLEGPDLTADAIDATGDFAFRGGTLEVLGTIGNEGLATGVDFYYGIYLSENALCSAVSDPLLGDFGPITLGPGQTTDFTQLVPVPANLPAVPHHVCLIVNNRSSVLEGNQNNNIARTTRLLDVRDPQADFTLTEVRLPDRAAAGESVSVQRTILNAGNATGGVDYDVYLSEDPVLDPAADVRLGRGTVSLDPGAEDIGVDTLRIPPDVPPGAYYAIYEVDPEGQVAELFEDNNRLASGDTVAVLPSDLVILTQSLPLATLDVPYDVFLAAQGGAGGLTWSVEQGSLPAGLSLDSATGRLFGTPSVPGAADLTIAVTDGALTASRSFVLLVSARSTILEIATRALPPGFVDRDYRYPLTALGGVAPYRWEIVSGDPLPAGLFFDDEEGLIFGAPTETGLSQFNLRVTDALGEFAERPLLLRVVDGSDSVRLSNDVLPDGRLDEVYDETLRVASGTGSSPFVFSFAGGELPPGLELDGERLFGTPERVGLYVFRVRVTDSRGDFDVNGYVVEIQEGSAGVTFLTNALPPATVGEDYLDEGRAVQIRALSSASTGSVAIGLATGALPPGLSLAEDGTVSGQPTASGTFSFLVLARDDLGQMDTRAYGIVVGEPAAAPPPIEAGEGGCRCLGAPTRAAPWGLGLLAGLLLGWCRRRRGGPVLGLLLALGLPGQAEAQSSIPYFVDTRTEAYTELPGGTVLNFQFSNDDGEAQVALPFPFRFYGTDYTSVNVGSNGLVVFGGGASSLDNRAMPDPASPNNLIAPWWDDLVTNRATVHEQGAAPNRVVVIQWEQVSAFGAAGGSPKFQVWLYEGAGGRFEVRYGNPGTTTAGWTASAGWENATGTEGGELLGCVSPNCDGAALAAADGRVVRVQADGGPDIVASAVRVPAVVYAGVPFGTDVTLSSLHQNPLGPFVYTVHVMAPGELTPNNPVFTSDPVTLAPYQTLTVTATPTVPLSLPNGRYRLAVVADSASEVVEPDEANNVFVSTDTLRLAPQQPDFVVPGVEADTQSPTPGTAFGATVYLRNRGNLAGTAAWRLVLSRNSVVSREDLSLHSDSVALERLSTATVSLQVTLPADTPAGQYYLGAVIDPDNLVPEIDEVNNSGVGAQPISVSTDAVRVATNALPGAYVGVDYTHFLRATGGDGDYAWSVEAGSLPAGLSLVPTTGELRGRPSAAASAAFTVRVESAGQTATAELALEVVEPDAGLVIVTTALLPGLVGAAYPPADPDTPAEDLQRIEVLGAQGEVTFSADGPLPPGFELGADGLLSGTPRQSGVFDVTVVARDDVEEARRTLPLTIAEPGRLTLVASTLPEGRLGDSYEYPLRVIGESRTATVTFTSQGPLPPGLVVSSDGRVVGIPQQVGSWTFVVTAAEGAGAGAVSDSATFRLDVVQDGAFEIVEDSLPFATVAEAYEVDLSTRGGDTPLTWRVMGPSLPRGLSFEVFMEGGVQSKLRFRGTPEEAEVVTILVTVTDAAGRTAATPFTLEVREPLAPTPPVLEDGGCVCVGGASQGPGLLGLGLLLGLAGLARRRRR